MLSYALLSVLPLAGAILTHAFRRARAVALLIALAVLLVALWISGRLPSGVQVSDVQLTFDPVARLAYTSLVMLAALAVVFGWLSREDNGLISVGLATTGLMGLTLSLSNDLLAAGLAFELAALSAAFVVGTRSAHDGSPFLSMRYVSYVVTAGVCLVGALSLAERFMVVRDPAIERVTFALLSVFILIVLGAFPFNFWFPKSLAVGDLMVIGIVVSALSIGGIWLFVRAYASFPWLLLEQRPIEVLTAIATIGAVAASLMAATRHRLDHLVAYSVASNAGTVVAGIAVGTPLGIVGGIFTLLNYLWALLLMLMCLSMSGRALIGADSSATLRRMSASVLGLCVGGLALAGAPPTGAFVGKWLIYQAVAARSSYLAILLVASSALVFLALARFLGGVLMGAPSIKERGGEPAGTAAMVIALAILSVAVGVYPTPILEVMSEAIARMPLL